VLLGRVHPNVSRTPRRPAGSVGRRRAPPDSREELRQRLARIGLNWQINRKSPQRNRLFERIDVELGDPRSVCWRYLTRNPRHVDVDQQHDIRFAQCRVGVVRNQRMIERRVQRTARVDSSHPQ